MTIMPIEITPKEEILSTMRAWLEETLGDSMDMLIQELVEMYLEDGPLLLQEVYQAIEQEDAKNLKDTAHTLKGSSASMGFEALVSHCQEVENCAISQDFQLARTKMCPLEAEFNQVISLLESLTE